MHPDLTAGHLEQETLYILSQQTRSRLQSGLRLPYTFAGVLREKKYLRAVLNATTTNYISIQS